MKPLIPILIVATTSLAVASVQFAQQASAQRERADSEMALRQKQDARIAQLLRSQSQLERELAIAREARGPAPPRLASSGMPPPRPGMQASGGTPPFAVESLERNGPSGMAFGGGRVRSMTDSPAGRNFMKTRMKSSVRRMYGDAGAALGLSKQKSEELIDLLADQQTRNMGRPALAEGQSFQQFAREQQQKNNTEIASLVGEDKLDEWAAYQKSLPERAQVNMVGEQLEAAGVPMTENQRTELLAAVSEETQRLPPRPAFTAGLPQEELAAQMNQWQTEYDKALMDRAKQVLNSEQYKAYKEYQDWQTEMRSNFAPGMRGNARVLAGPNVMFEAAPVVMPLPAQPIERK